MITYAVEEWADTWKEMEPLWPDHWKEVAMDQDVIPLNPDLEVWDELARKRMLHLVTVREDDKLIGYYLAIIRPHLHYKQSLSAFTDLYYLSARHRRGLTGYKLFQYVESTLKARGVQKMFAGTKMHLDMGRLFERLGWRETERLYTKVIDNPEAPGETWEIETFQDAPRGE